MSLNDFVDRFGDQNSAPESSFSEGTPALPFNLNVQQPGALDAFIDQFQGVTEPYFFYFVEGVPTVELRFQTDEHIYYLVGELGQLTAQDGVTTICHIIDKSNALVPWAAKMVVAKLLRTIPVIEGEDEGGVKKQYLATISLESFEKIALEAKSAPRDNLEEAGNVGHMAHEWLEFYIKSLIALRLAKEAGNEQAATEHQQAIESKLANLPGDERAASCVKAALAWINEHNVQFVETERKIYSKKYSYAGTMDGLAHVSSCNDPTCCAEKFENRLSIIDWKSSNYLYIEYLYQTAAYEAAYEEEFGVDIADRWIIRLGKEDGEFDPWHTLPEDFQEDIEGFLDALSLHRSVASTNERMKSQKNARKEIKKKLKEAAKEAEKAQRKEARAALVAANRMAKLAEKTAKKLKGKEDRAAVKAGVMAAIGYGTDADIQSALEELQLVEDEILKSIENQPTIEELKTESDLRLNEAASKVFIEAVENPPEPNEALRKAVIGNMHSLPTPTEPIVNGILTTMEFPVERVAPLKIQLPEEK
jgi:hypothetical protein